jgi:hypothetical protein
MGIGQRTKRHRQPVNIYAGYLSSDRVLFSLCHLGLPVPVSLLYAMTLSHLNPDFGVGITFATATEPKLNRKKG